MAAVGTRAWSVWQMAAQDARADLEMTTTVRPVPTVAPPQDPAPEDTHPVLLTTPEDAAQWLHSLAPEEICGRPHMANECPLANYLNARNGHPARGATVGSDSYDLGAERHPLPWWARRFLQGVDAIPARLSRPAAHGVTAAEALHLLEGVRRLEEGR